MIPKYNFVLSLIAGIIIYSIQPVSAQFVKEKMIVEGNTIKSKPSSCY
jgi:hypothetical protein